MKLHFDCRGRSLARRRFDAEGRAETLAPLAYAGKSEMSVCLSWTLPDIEPNAVIADRHAQHPVIDRAAYRDPRRLAVDGSIRDEFPDDSEKGMCRRIAEPRTRHFAVDVDFSMTRYWFRSKCHGLCEVWLVQRVASQVPDAPPKFCAARLEHVFGDR